MGTDIINKAKPRIVRGRIELWTPHTDKEIAFAYPSVGPNIYRELGKVILANNQLVPHGDYTAALLHAAYCVPEVRDEPEYKNVRDIMRRRWLSVFNKNRWTTNGVYVVQDTKAVGLSEPLPDNLETLLEGATEVDGVRFSKNGKVRFAPKGTYQLGELTTDAFAKDGFVRASVGIEGAQKLAEVASCFKYNPRTWGLEIGENQDPEERVSALGDYVGSRLDLYGDYFGDGSGGHAFGVLQ
ncbi:MAG: hypothetical protein RL557_563 [archaeon]|jgi:hypothetical protein